MNRLSEKPDTGRMPFLSDHTYQSACFSFYTADDQLLFSLSGSTWNLQDRGFSKRLEVKNSFSNNPWDIEECLKEYIRRKHNQIDKILKEIMIGKDFIFLQEIDFLVSNDKVSYKTPQKVKTQLKAFFQRKIHEVSWRLLLTPSVSSDSDEKEHHPLGILYNTKTLFYISESKGLFEHPRSGYRANEWRFIHIGSHKNIALTNLHLAYDIDYSDLIYQYQCEQIKHNLLTIMGGDTNHPSMEMVSAIGKGQYATNLEQRDNYSQVSHIDNRTHFVKDYDCFFVNPTKNSYVTFSELKGEYFNSDEGALI
jgi:hypothetical protein